MQMLNTTQLVGSTAVYSSKQRIGVYAMQYKSKLNITKLYTIVSEASGRLPVSPGPSIANLHQNYTNFV